MHTEPFQFITDRFCNLPAFDYCGVRPQNNSFFAPDTTFSASASTDNAPKPRPHRLAVTGQLPMSLLGRTNPSATRESVIRHAVIWAVVLAVAYPMAAHRRP
jgi:hypothetical protein